MEWVKVFENKLENNSYTNKELEEKFGLDYIEPIDKLGLNDKNWEELYKKVPSACFGDPDCEGDPDVIIQRLEKLGLPTLPEEINFCSDCDGYDTCWDNRWYLDEGEDGVWYLAFEQYAVSSNKCYGKYDPDAPATLSHTLIVYKLVRFLFFTLFSPATFFVESNLS